MTDVTDEERTLEEAVEELCESQVKEETLQDEVAQLATDASVATINNLPLLYRMEIKKVLKREDSDRADQIET